MSHIYVEQGNIAELTNAKFLDNLKDTVDKDNLDNSSDLKGILQTAHIYDDTSKFFVTKYPRLSIICTNGQYIRFKDETLFDILLNYNNLGDGVGITIEDAGNVTSWPTWQGANNTQTFETFDELKYFTRLTTVPQNKFADFSSLKSIDLINIITIGPVSFQKSSIQYLNAPNATNIGWNAFSNCDELIEADISSFSTPGDTGWGMFSGCDSLKKIIVNPNLTKIPGSWVSECINLEEIENLNFSNITEIGARAFAYLEKLSALETFTNNNITKINGKVFFQNKVVKNINCPNVTQLINNDQTYGGIFQGASNLKSAVFSSELTTIPSLCFRESGLESFDFSNITTIGGDAFRNTKITTLNAPSLTSITGGSSFNNCKQLTIINAPLLDTINGTNIFDGCSEITSITFTNLKNIPPFTFYNCTNVKTITLASQVNIIGEQAFRYCNNLEHVYFDTYTSKGISAHAFRQCPKLISVNLTSLTQVSEELFSDCSELTSTGIDFTNVTLLGYHCFNNCKKLTGEVICSSLITLNGAVFYGCENLTKIDVSHATEFTWNAWNGWFQGCKNATIIILPTTLTYLPPHTFNGCTSLKNVDISNITEFIKTNNQESQFRNCTSLESIIFNPAVTFIPSFEGCTSLTEVTIPANVTSISSFKSCTGLDKVTILAETPPTIGHEDTFRYGSFDYPIYVPAASVDIYKAADKWSKLASRIFPIE